MVYSHVFGFLPFRYNVEEQLRAGLLSVLAGYHLTGLLSAADSPTGGPDDPPDSPSFEVDQCR
jgi:hypothetical protein